MNPRDLPKDARRALLALAGEVKRSGRRAAAELDGAIRPRSIVPDYVWEGGRWQVAGEFADVPKRFLDLRAEKVPKDPPTSTGSLRATISGNVDDVADQVGLTGDELREWLAAAEGRAVKVDPAYGYCAADVRKARSVLRKFCRAPALAGEALLVQALVALYEGRELAFVGAGDVAERMRKTRASKRERGYCTIRIYGCAGVARDGLATCQHCQDDKARRKREKRAALRGEIVPQDAPVSAGAAEANSGALDAVDSLLADLDRLAEV